MDYPDALNWALEGVSVYRGNVSGQNIRRFLKNFELDLDNHGPAVVRQGFVKWFNGILRNQIAGIWERKRRQLL
ncbi:MAG: hypothetical protein EBE86_002225 [Hormoscilla sp. GUM202]|nr:hypothetical protein [Hormoscilla sp. GUM202]